jgi:excisionase family DNA binding protein
MMNIPGQASGHAANHVGRKDNSQYFSVKAIAERLDISPRTVHRWIKSKELAVYRLGGAVRISEVDLKRYLAAHHDGD